METVFITVHDLSLDARIKYCSDSIEDVLGYLPHEVKGKSCWEYFHPDEIPFAKVIHGRGISLDKAAVLNYCRVRHKDGTWIGCECVFTIVYDVLVASTAIYQRGPKSQRRAVDGAGIRRIFSSSPRDPRYHMLSYISHQFHQEPKPHAREPRAALFLNRFTRTSTIMFATNGVASILGLQPSQLIGKSLYYCIAPNCLDDAIRCLESAKANDSIAYMRFWFRDPTQEGLHLRDTSATTSMSEDDDDEGGVVVPPGRELPGSMQITTSPLLSEKDLMTKVAEDSVIGPTLGAADEKKPVGEEAVLVNSDDTLGSGEALTQGETQSRSSSDDSNRANNTRRDAVFDPPSLPHQSSASSTTPMEETTPIEIEAVVSCTSDGLVLVLRRARPLIPHTAGNTEVPYFANGLFASPWASEPVLPPGVDQATVAPTVAFPASSEPVESGFMAAIRDVAVFAWSLTGINGSLVDHSRGQPLGEALPPGGLPVWDPNADVDDVNNERWNGYSNSTHRRTENLGESQRGQAEEPLSSDDEVLYKRMPQQPPWRRPKRRGHHDAFGCEEEADDAEREYGNAREFKRGRKHIESGN